MNQTKAADAATKGRLIRWARAYDRLLAVLTLGREAALRREIVARAALRPGERVLDIGCGTGTLAIAAAETQPACEVLGIDPASAMVARAREKARATGVTARFEVGAIEKLPADDASFDVVLSSLMLHHVPEESRVEGLREVRRVLRPGGRLVLVDFAGRTLLFHGILARLTGRSAIASPAVEHVEREVTEAGFERPSVHAMSFRYLFCLVANKPGSGPS